MCNATVGTHAYRRAKDEERLNERPRLQCSITDDTDEKEAKQNKRNTRARERRHDICKPNARRVQVRMWWRGTTIFMATWREEEQHEAIKQKKVA